MAIVMNICLYISYIYINKLIPCFIVLGLVLCLFFNHYSIWRSFQLGNIVLLNLCFSCALYAAGCRHLSQPQALLGPEDGPGLPLLISHRLRVVKSPKPGAWSLAAWHSVPALPLSDLGKWLHLSEVNFLICKMRV